MAGRTWLAQSMGRIFTITLLSCTTWGCVHQGIKKDVPNSSWSYDVAFVADFELDYTDGAWAPMQHFQEAVQADIGVRYTRAFRDDSVGWWVEVNQMSVETTREGTTVRTDPHPLQGLGVELRRFGDGEILQIDQAEYWMGGERGGETYDFLFPVISPHPPDLARGGQSHRRTRWPFSASRILGWANYQEAEWFNEGTLHIDGQKVWRLRYEGIWRVEGGSKAPMPASRVSGSGPVSGVVLVRMADYRVIEHTFDWTRSVLLELEGSDTAVVAQKQQFIGSIRLSQ